MSSVSIDKSPGPVSQNVHLVPVASGGKVEKDFKTATMGVLIANQSRLGEAYKNREAAKKDIVQAERGIKQAQTAQAEGQKNVAVIDKQIKILLVKNIYGVFNFANKPQLDGKIGNNINKLFLEDNSVVSEKNIKDGNMWPTIKKVTGLNKFLTAHPQVEELDFSAVVLSAEVLNGPDFQSFMDLISKSTKIAKITLNQFTAPTVREKLEEAKTARQATNAPLQIAPSA